MKYRFAIAITLGALILLASVYFLSEWYRIYARCTDAAATELASFKNAFGRAGHQSARFRPKYAFTCKEVLCVECDPTRAAPDELGDILAGLQADLRIADSKDEAVLEAELTEDRFLPIWTGDQQLAQPLPAFHFSPVPPGDYELQLDVRQPASHLAGTPHRVVLKYQLCGLEWYPVWCVGGIAVLCLLTGGGILITAIASARRTRRRIMNQ